MKRARPKTVWLLAGVMILLLGWLIWSAREEHSRKMQQRLEATRGIKVNSPSLALSNSLPVPAQSLAQSVDHLRSAGGPVEARRILAELRSALSTLTPDEMAPILQKFLDSGVDAPTRIDFEVGMNGFLRGAPTLRVYLLDYLGQVNPIAASVYAEKILAQSDSPDEWAVAFRNYGLVRQTAGEKAFLRDRFLELAGREAWRENASTGYLESFDVAVHLGGTELLPTLTGFVRQKDNQAVSHAAYLALDRLALREPATVLAELQSHPETMEGRERTRANYFARADVRDPNQRAVVETYLLDPSRAPEELNVFAGLFPNGNFDVAPGLLTKGGELNPGDQPFQDRYALQTVERWMADPRFVEVRPHLDRIRSRLEKFVGQAARAAIPGATVQ